MPYQRKTHRFDVNNGFFDLDYYVQGRATDSRRPLGLGIGGGDAKPASALARQLLALSAASATTRTRPAVGAEAAAFLAYDQVQSKRLSRGGNSGKGLLQNGERSRLVRCQYGLSLLRKLRFRLGDLTVDVSDIELDLTNHRGVRVVALKLIAQLRLKHANLLAVRLGRFSKRGIDVLELLDLLGAQLKGFLHRLELIAILPVTSLAARRITAGKLRGQANAENYYGNDVFDQSHFCSSSEFMSAPWGCTVLEHAAAGIVYRRL